MKIGNINNTMLFSIISLFYMIFFALGFASKKKIKSTELSIFKGLIFSNMASLIVEILLVVLILLDSSFLTIALKTFNICILLYVWTFGLYSYYTVKDEKNLEINHFLFMIYIVFFVVCSVVMLLLPININLVDYKQYSYGPSVSFLFFAISIVVTATLFLLILNYKKLKANKCTPILLFIFFIGLNAIIQFIWPSVLLANSFFSFITFLMYFTVENPDVKMVKELTYSKEMVERANTATMNSLNNLSQIVSNALSKLFIFGNKKINKDNIDEIIEETESMKKISIELVDQINGIIDLSKIESSKYELIKTNYDTYEMINQIVALFKAKINDIKIETSFSDNMPKVLYGDAEKIKQTILYLFNAINNNYNNKNIIFKVFTLNVKSLCRLKFEIILDNNEISDSISINPASGQKYIDLKGLDFKIFDKLIELQNGSFNINYGEKNVSFIFSIDQRNVKEYDILNPIVEKTNSKINVFDASNKRILIVDDNRSKIKHLIKILEPYNVEFGIAHNYEEYNNQLYGNITWDLILLDDMMPDSEKFEYLNVDHLQNNKILEKIEKIAGYKIPMVIMITPNKLGIEKKYDMIKIDHISKPVDELALNTLLKKYLGNN